MDIAWHRDPVYYPSIKDYMLMCSLKTGYLARFAALLGVEAARIALNKSTSTEIDEDLAALLGMAAQKLGVGFQILDDVKNLGEGIRGKKRGDDLVEGKKSLPVLLFLLADAGNSESGADNSVSVADPAGEKAAFVQRCFTAARNGGVDVPEVEEFAAALTEAGALATAEKQGKALITEAAAVFSALPAADSGAGRLLAGLTELLQ